MVHVEAELEVELEEEVVLDEVPVELDVDVEPNDPVELELVGPVKELDDDETEWTVMVEMLELEVEETEVDVEELSTVDTLDVMPMKA